MCSDIPNFFEATIDTCSTNVEVCSTVNGMTESTVCSNTIWPPLSTGQYRLSMTYASSDCTGAYSAVVGNLVDTCLPAGFLFRKYTCSGGKINTLFCSDSACSTNCTTSSVDDGVCIESLPLSSETAPSSAVFLKYECSSGFQTAVFASVTGLLAAVASALSFF